MYLGQFFLGQEIVLPLLTTNAAPSAVAPDRAPSLKVLSAAGSVVASGLMPALDTIRSVGLFQFRLRLGDTFAIGRYIVAMSYTIAGVTRLKVCHFDIVAGGDTAGAVLSMYHLERPQAKFIVSKTDAGKRTLRRSPYL